LPSNDFGLSELYSDNGTTLQIERIEIAQGQDEEISNFLPSREISWHFIPPSAENFGSIWETSERSIRLQFKRVIDSCAIEFKKHLTPLCQIKGLLNSRPLCAPSDHSFSPVTSSNFLTGQPSTSLPELSFLDVYINRLQRWRHLQVKVQGLGKRENLEYLNSISFCTKWQQDAENVAIDIVVVLKELNQPPSELLLGRII